MGSVEELIIIYLTSAGNICKFGCEAAAWLICNGNNWKRRASRFPYWGFWFVESRLCDYCIWTLVLEFEFPYLKRHMDYFMWIKWRRYKARWKRDWLSAPYICLPSVLFPSASSSSITVLAFCMICTIGSFPAHHPYIYLRFSALEPVLCAYTMLWSSFYSLKS